MRRSPLLLRLTPSRLLRGRSGLASALRDGVPRPQIRAWVSRFELSSRERAFARSLLQRHTQLWLFRCAQAAAAGDFVLVDMSDARPGCRRVRILELKQDRPVKQLGAQAAQVSGAIQAVERLVHQGFLTEPRWTCWRGGGPELLASIASRPGALLV